MKGKKLSRNFPACTNFLVDEILSKAYKFLLSQRVPVYTDFTVPFHISTPCQSILASRAVSGCAH